MNIVRKYTISIFICISLFLMRLPVVAQNPLSAYIGTYKRDVNGYHAYVNVYIENSKLRVKQSWDGKIRTLEYLNNNKFMIAMDGWAIKFIRNKANKVIQMQVLASEIWLKV